MDDLLVNPVVWHDGGVEDIRIDIAGEAMI